MTTLNHLQHPLSTARDVTFNLTTQRVAAALVLAMGLAGSPLAVAGDLMDQDAQAAAELAVVRAQAAVDTQAVADKQVVVREKITLPAAEQVTSPSTQKADVSEDIVREQITLPKKIAVSMPPPERVASLLDRTQFDYPAYRRYVKEQKEAKIRAQTQYLAAKFGHSESNIRKYVELAWKEASQRDGVPAELLIAMMSKESSLRPKVQSNYGAQGLMQVVRRWHHDKLRPSESLFDPEVNIRVGADVLEEYLTKADGSLTKALKKYSGNASGYATKVLNESYKLARVAAEAARDVLASKG